MKLMKKDIFAILVALVVFTLMAYVLGAVLDTKPKWIAAIGGAIGFLAVYFYGRFKKLR
jgi:membrane protease YdiL (CAAX protease family)